MSIEKLSDVKGTTDPVPYAQIANECLQSIRNTDAMAIWCYLQSLPSDWTLRKAHMMDHFQISRERYAKALRCLCDAGLVSYQRVKIDGGLLAGSIVRVHRLPAIHSTGNTDFREAGKAATYKENTSTKETKNTKETPASPAEPKKRKPRKSDLTLREWIAGQPKGDELIGPDHPSRKFAREAGIPDGWVALAFRAFTDKHLASDKRYKDWGAAFRNAVAGNWEKVWFMHEDGQWRLTTVGHGLDRVVNGGGQ